MKVNLSFYIALISLALLSACHRQRQKSKVQSTADTLTVVQTDTLSFPKKDSVAVIKPNAESEELKVNIENVDFKYLTAKSKISFKVIILSKDSPAGHK